MSLQAPPATFERRRWYRSTFWAATVLGLANLAAPGIWGAMSSLGGGGLQKPYVVNAANALTFVLMVITATLGSTIVNRTSVRFALSLGGLGYSVYAGGLLLNNLTGNPVLTLVGAALCGATAGLFWAVEAAIAFSYFEPANAGRYVAYWLSFRVAGQIIGGAVNLGINAKNAEAGKVSYQVFIVFIILQALGPAVAWLLPPPAKVQRSDGVPVKMYSGLGFKDELRAVARIFFTKEFLLLVPLITQAVFPEAFNFSYIGLYFSVRARALGSFLSAIVAIIAGNLLGSFLDYRRISHKIRARVAFVAIMSMQGAWWTWSTVIQNEFQKNKTVLDWTSPGFGRGFALFLFLSIGFQLNYMFLYFAVVSSVKELPDIVRIAGLLRATESAAQSVSYGLNSVASFLTVGASALNFALWGISIIPAWLVVRQIGVTLNGKEALEQELLLAQSDAGHEKRSSGSITGGETASKASRDEEKDA